MTGKCFSPWRCNKKKRWLREVSSSHTQGFDHNFWSWWDFNKRKTILQSPFPVVVFWGRKKKHNSTMQIQNLGVCLKTKFIHFFFVWSISMLSSGRHILDLSGFQFSPLEYWWIPYSWWSGTLLLSINCVIRSPCLICNLLWFHRSIKIPEKNLHPSSIPLTNQGRNFWIIIFDRSLLYYPYFYVSPWT